MGNWMEKLRWKLAGWMQGRYGVDVLFRDLYKVGFVFWLVSLLLPIRIFRILFYFCFLYAIYRAFSKNIVRRREELSAYLNWRKKPERFFRRKKREWQDRKTHRYFKCPCGTVLRVPKGKGKIRIHCQNCDRYMIKKT